MEELKDVPCSANQSEVGTDRRAVRNTRRAQRSRPTNELRQICEPL
jgi:hypothetical protein